jgi:hypothetical protein
VHDGELGHNAEATALFGTTLQSASMRQLEQKLFQLATKREAAA